MLGIGYVDVIRIPYSCSARLNKLDSTWNRRQDKYNQVRYKGENKQGDYWSILGPYKYWKIIHCIDSREQHGETKTDINFYIKQNATRNIYLSIRKYISDKDYGAIYTIYKKCRNHILSC